MGNKLHELKPVFVETIPKDLEDGILYISRKFEIAIHLCACGCKEKTVTPIGGPHGGWALTEIEGKITLRPSIGNFKGENPYHAHYYITNNKIQWL